MEVIKGGDKTIYKCGKRFEPKKAAHKKAEPKPEEPDKDADTEEK